jgi:hypothetical protein
MENGMDHLGDLYVDGRILLKWILREKDMRLWAGFIWLSIGISDRLL